MGSLSRSFFLILSTLIRINADVLSMRYRRCVFFISSTNNNHRRLVYIFQVLTIVLTVRPIHNYRSIVVVVSRARRAEPEIGGNLIPPDGSNRRFVSTTTERVRSESDAGVFPSDNCISRILSCLSYGSRDSLFS